MSMVETLERPEEVDAEPPLRAGASSMRRLRLAEAVAFVGLLAAFVAALGPADKARTTYLWPPVALP